MWLFQQAGYTSSIVSFLLWQFDSIVFIIYTISTFAFLVKSVWQCAQLVLYTFKIRKLMHDYSNFNFHGGISIDPRFRRSDSANPKAAPHPVLLSRCSEGPLGSRGSCLAYSLIGHDSSGELSLSLLEAGIGLPVHAVDLRRRRRRVHWHLICAAIHCHIIGTMRVKTTPGTWYVAFLRGSLLSAGCMSPRATLWTQNNDVPHHGRLQSDSVTAVMSGGIGQNCSGCGKILKTLIKNMQRTSNTAKHQGKVEKILKLSKF